MDQPVAAPCSKSYTVALAPLTGLQLVGALLAAHSRQVVLACLILST